MAHVLRGHPYSARAARRSGSGFTLIELLVVIAIIGLLSSIVLASLNTARSKAKDATIESELHQLATLAELEYSNSGSYTNIQPGHWFTSTADCNSYFGGSLVADIRQICTVIVTNSGNNNFWAGNAFSGATKYSFMAYLPGSNSYGCVGDDGGTSINTPAPADNWNRAGCYSDPGL